MEVMLPHQLQCFFVFCFYPPNSEGKRVTIRIQTITDKSEDPNHTACSEVWRKGGREGGRGDADWVLRDYGPKGCLNGRPTDLSLHSAGNW